MHTSIAGPQKHSRSGSAVFLARFAGGGFAAVVAASDVCAAFFVADEAVGLPTNVPHKLQHKNARVSPTRLAQRQSCRKINKKTAT
jgi:hypothetical protein